MEYEGQFRPILNIVTESATGFHASGFLIPCLPSKFERFTGEAYERIAALAGMRSCPISAAIGKAVAVRDPAPDGPAKAPVSLDRRTRVPSSEATDRISMHSRIDCPNPESSLTTSVPP